MLTVNIVSPHQDDAALSLATTIEQLIDSGHRVRIVNCFTVSRFAPYTRATDPTGTVAELRDAEDHEFASRLGSAVEIHNLGRVDAPLRLRCRVSDVRTASPLRPSDRNEAAVIGAALDQYAPGILLLPLGIGSHVDHRVALEAGFNSRAEGRLLGFYEDLPYTAESRPCCVPTAVASAGRRAGAALLAALAGPSLPPGHKRDLIDCYRSQVSADQMNAIVNYARRLHGCERLWLTPALTQEFSRSGFRFAAPPIPANRQLLRRRLQCLTHVSVDRARRAVRNALRSAIRGDGLHEATYS